MAKCKNNRGAEFSALGVAARRGAALRRYYANPNICLSCGKVIPVPEGTKIHDVRGKKYCDAICYRTQKAKGRATRERILEQQRNRSRRLRLAVLAAYGNVCACCGEGCERFLSIDHINNDGAKQRRETKQRTGTHFYRWLTLNGFPPGFQVLCYNCNLGKARNGGICPHKVHDCGDEAKAAYLAHDQEFRSGANPDPATTLVN